MLSQINQAGNHKGKLQQILKVTQNLQSQHNFFQKRTNSSQKHLSTQTPSSKLRLTELSPGGSQMIRELMKSSLQESRSTKDKMFSLDNKRSYIKQSASQKDLLQGSMVNLKGSLKMSDSYYQGQDMPQIYIKDENPYQNNKGYSKMNIRDQNDSKNTSYLQINASPNLAFMSSSYVQYAQQAAGMSLNPGIPSMLVSQINPSQMTLATKLTSRQQEINNLRLKMAKLEKENQDLNAYFNQVNEFKYAMENFQENYTNENIDQRRLLLLKSQVLSLQRQNQVYKETIHSQQKLASECLKFCKWVEAIMQEAQRHSMPKFMTRKQNQDSYDDYQDKQKNSNAFDPDEEDINEATLKNIFKDYNLKIKFENLRKLMEDVQLTSRKAHSINVLKNNQYIYEDRGGKREGKSRSPSKTKFIIGGAQKLRGADNRNGRNQNQTSKNLKREEIPKISIKLNQEKILLAESKLSTLMKHLIDINTLLYTDNKIPSTDDMCNLSKQMRESIDILLTLGVTPFYLAGFQLQDFQPDHYYVSRITNASDEWIQYIRDRVGVQGLSKFNEFIRKDHSVLNSFQVRSIFNLVNSAQESNIKKKQLTLLVNNLKRIENRYETSFQLINKQNQLLIKLFQQLNMHVEKLTQFNIKQHQFYEKSLLQNIYTPFMELTKYQEKIENSEKERKDLLMFYQKFQSLRETFENGFKSFILVEETEVKLNNSILELMKVYEKNLQKLKGNFLDWEKITDIHYASQNEIEGDQRISEQDEDKDVDTYEDEEVNQQNLLILNNSL